MDNSDDYFDDSFVLNEDDLALLDAEEEKHAQSIDGKGLDQSQVSKRRKLLHQYEAEDPDISLQFNGTYGVDTDFWTLYEDNTVLADDIQGNAADAGAVTRVCEPMQRGSDNSNDLSIQKTADPSSSGRAQKSRAPSIAPSRALTAGSSRVVVRNDSAKMEGAVTHEEVAQLRAQLENLMREQNRAKEALKEFEIARFAKEGEVSILRKRVEKAAEQHAADLRKLKEMKESAEAEKARLLKEMNEQKERLQTELAFKKFEVESSVRKPGSTRSKRIGSVHHPSPAHISSSLSIRPDKGKGVSRDRIGTMEATQQGGSRFARPVQARFPGFENTFLQSSPTKSPSRRRAAGYTQECSIAHTPSRRGVRSAKASAKDGRANGLFSPVKSPPISLHAEPKGKLDFQPVGEIIQDFDTDLFVGGSSPTRQPRANAAGSSPAIDRTDYSSVLGSDLVEEPEEDNGDEADSFEGINWMDELHSLLFSHENGFSDTLTFQYLLSAPVSSENGYRQCCSAILEALGTKYKYLVFSNFLDEITTRLLKMSTMLRESKLYMHLGALFDLLRSIAIHIPASTVSIMRSFDNGQEPLSKTIKETLLGISEPNADEEAYSRVTLSALALLETITWLLPEHLADRFDDIASDDRPFCVLLDDKGSSIVQKHTLQLLALLATYPQLCKFFISPAGHEKNIRQASGNHGSRLPLLERLCTLLLQDKDGSDHELPSLVLTFFALLVTANADCKSVTRSQTSLIPCLVSHLCRLTCFIWEEADPTSEMIAVVSSVIRNIRQSIHLLHCLAFDSTSDSSEAYNSTDIDLRQKLYHAPPQMFNGLVHMFIVMISRLSYADPPEWLPTELQTHLLRITEPSRDLMDLVVEGPESDSIWGVYQEAEADESQEEERSSEIAMNGDEQPSLEL